MRSRIVCLASVVCLMVLASSVLASVINVAPTSGTDSTGAVAASFTATDITRLALSDDSRVQSNAAWPVNLGYDETKFLEFDFTVNVPAGSAINSVMLSNEYRRSGVLNRAKLEVWTGSAFVDALAIGGQVAPTTNVDFIQQADATAILGTVGQVNDLRVRFLAARDTTASITTSHDQVLATIDYTPVPEPSAIILVALGFALFFQRSR